MDKSTISILIDNMAAPAFVIGEDGKVVMKNRRMHYIRDILDKPELSHIDEMDIVMDDHKDEHAIAFHVEGSSLDGIMYCIGTEEGEVLRLFIFDRSIANDRMIENVIEHIDEVVVIFDAEGTLEKMNTVCDQILPFKRREVVGKNINQLVEKGLVEDPIILKCIERQEKVYKDILYPTGTIISYTAIPIFGMSGRFRGGVLTGRDISRIMNLAKNTITEDDEDIEYISVNNEINEIKAMITRVAPSDASVFIIGESGVGKEILAKSIWKQSLRREKSFVAINCAAIPSELIESELFGYEKGAFTGANKEGKVGLIEAADGGTLFLDEIGELPLETQKKLLRVIQEKSVTRIGGIKPKKVDVRFVSATNKTLQQLQDPKLFRQDLYYRLSVIPVIVPPLRNRPEDIRPICDFYIDYFNKKYNRSIFLEEEAYEVLKKHEWSGNIRELKNVVERVVVLSTHEHIDTEEMKRVIDLGAINEMQDLVPRTQPIEYPKKADNEITIMITDDMSIDEAHRIIEQEMLKKAVEKHGNITNAAKAVGINPSTVYRKIKSGYIEL